jgi:energy-coupling factor transporter transmembrane protein EcfT
MTNTAGAPPKGNGLAKIIHPVSAFLMLLHIIFAQFMRVIPCPDSGPCPDHEIELRWYAYVAFVAIIVLFVSVGINVSESKKGEGKLTSIMGIVGGVFWLVYFVMWQFADSDLSDFRKLVSAFDLDTTFTWTLAGILSWINAIMAIVCCLIPTIMGGLTGGAQSNKL